MLLHYLVKMLLHYLVKMLLHYYVKLEMLITHVLAWSCYRKKLQKLSRLNCGLQIHQL